MSNCLDLQYSGKGYTTWNYSCTVLCLVFRYISCYCIMYILVFWDSVSYSYSHPCSKLKNNIFCKVSLYIMYLRTSYNCNILAFPPTECICIWGKNHQACNPCTMYTVKKENKWKTNYSFMFFFNKIKKSLIAGPHENHRNLFHIYYISTIFPLRVLYSEHSQLAFLTVLPLLAA